MSNKKIYTNTLAQIGGKLMTALISIFMISILTGYLGVAGFGTYGLLYSYLGIFAVLADMGLYTISVREMSKYQEDEEKIRKIANSILTLRLISGIMIIGISLILAPLIGGISSASSMLGVAIVGCFTLAGLINSSLMSYLQAILKTEFSFVANTSGKLLTFGLIILASSVLFPITSGINEGYRLILVLLAGLLGNILMTGMTWWYASRYIKFSIDFDIVYIKNILFQSIPYGLALFFGAIFFKIDSILIAMVGDPETREVANGLYGLPMKIVEVGMMYGTIFLNSLLPVLTKALEKNDVPSIKKLTNHGYELLILFGVVASIILYLFAPEIIRILASDEAFLTETVAGYSSIDAMRVTAGIFLCYSIISLSNYILIARGEQKKIMYANGILALFNIVGNLLVIQMYSFFGSAVVSLLSQILLMIVTVFLVRKDIPLLRISLFFLTIVTSAILGGAIAIEIISTLGLIHTETKIGALIVILIGSSIVGISTLGSWYIIKKLKI